MLDEQPIDLTLQTRHEGGLCWQRQLTRAALQRRIRVLAQSLDLAEDQCERDVLVAAVCRDELLKGPCADGPDAQR